MNFRGCKSRATGGGRYCPWCNIHGRIEAIGENSLMLKTEMEEKTRNLTVEFSADALEMLDVLRKKLNKKSKAEILRTGLLLLNFVQEQREKGHQLALVKDGEVKMVELFL